MTSRILVTTFGNDRPGIVEEIAEWVAKHGGNIEDSRMAALGGIFATIILVGGEEGLLASLESGRGDFERGANLRVRLQPAADPAGATEARLRYSLVATSLDHAGIVHRIAALLREREINIVSAETRRESAPFSGAPVFQLEMEIDIPSRIPVARLRAELSDFSERENIDTALTAM